MLAPNRDPLHQEIAALRDQLALRDEQVRQLKQDFAPVMAFPHAWRLTSCETAMLGALHAAKSGVLSKEALHVAMSGLEVETEVKIVDVFICKMRRKLSRVGVRIETRWGFGYALPPDSRRVIAAALAGEPVIQEEETVAKQTLPAPITELSASDRPVELLDVAIALLTTGRGRSRGELGTLIDAAAILLGAVRSDESVLAAEDSEPPARAAARPAARRNGGGRTASKAPAAEPLTGPLRDVINGVTVDRTPDAELVAHGGSEMEISTRQAILFAILARAMPQPVERTFIIKKLWAPARPPKSADAVLNTIVADSKGAAEAVGLVLKVVRGVGIALQLPEA